MEPDQETVEDSSTFSVDLTETDIPGESLEEPLDSQNVSALRWWLLCHGITPLSLIVKRDEIFACSNFAYSSLFLAFSTLILANSAVLSSTVFLHPPCLQ